MFLAAYFTQATVDRLGSVDDIPGVGDLVVPDGLFRSTRVAKSRSKPDEASGSRSSATTVPRTYSAFPSPFPNMPSQQETSPVSPSVQMFEPYPNYNGLQSQRPATPQLPEPPAIRPAHHTMGQSPYYSVNSQNPSLTLSTNYSYEPNTNFPASGHPVEDSPERGSLSSALVYQPSHSLKVCSGVSPTQGSASNVLYASPDHPPPNRTRYNLHIETSSIENQQSIAHPSPSYTLSSSILSSTYLAPQASSEDPYVYYDTSHFSSSPLSADPHSTDTVSAAEATVAVSANPVPSPIFSSHATPDYSFEEECVSSTDSGSSDGRDGDIGPNRVALAPLQILKRGHPYKRDPVDDNALRLLDPRRVASVV